MSKASNVSQAENWYVVVPTTAEFTKPQFHFGERVSWWLSEQGDSYRITGRIVGMSFYEDKWTYDIRLDVSNTQDIELEEFVSLCREDLKLVYDDCTLQDQADPLCEWLPTRRAAQRLGLLPEQLRHLRLQGRFIVGHHCRDASIPGSKKPLWQWHVGRCNEALADCLSEVALSSPENQ